MKFIHLTDPHFIPPGKTLYGRDPRIALDAAVADINAANSDAEMVVITGDLTHWGEPEAFANLADCLAPLTMPVKLLIGNHDHRPDLSRTFPGPQPMRTVSCNRSMKPRPVCSSFSTPCLKAPMPAIFANNAAPG